MAKINGQAFAFGDAALRHQVAELPRGAERYVREYYGVIAAYVLSQALGKSDYKVNLYASHAPGDFDYAPYLVAAAEGDWVVECKGGTHEFSVQNVQTFDEPFGGYSHVIFTQTGDEVKKNPLSGKTVLVIDVGGFTVDVVVIENTGEIDTLSAQSIEGGIISMMEGFKKELKGNNRAIFRGSRDLDPRRVESALMTGIYQFGNTPIDCVQESTEALFLLGNEVKGIIDSQGRAGHFDIALVTGGGTALLYDTLTQLVPRLDFVKAEQDTRLLHLANVTGGAKLSAAMRKMGIAW